MIIVGLLVGLVIGAGLFYVLKKEDLERIETLETELQKVRQDLLHADEQHELRLKEAIAALQSDYQKKQDRQILTLQTEYETRIHDLEAQLQAQPVALAEPEISQPEIAQPEITQPETEPTVSEPTVTEETSTEETSTEETSEQPSATVETTPNTFEPPILATNIQPLQDKPEVILSNPTGKAIDPPILAQGVTATHEPEPAPQENPVTENTQTNTQTTFEPPILATDIQPLQDKPAVILSNPTGKAIDPPILAQ